MQKKTLARINKREAYRIKEVHVLDTSILIGATLEFAERKSGPYLKYFVRLRSDKKYRAYVPLAAYGESFEQLPHLLAQEDLATALLELIELTEDTVTPHYPSDIRTYCECLEKAMEVNNRCGTTDAIILAEGIMLKQKLHKEGYEKNVYLITDDRKISCKELAVKCMEDVDY